MELVGVHPTCLIKKTKSSFEEAHHWNIQAMFYSVRIPTQLCMNYMIISMEYKYYKEYECGSFKRNSSVSPFSLFISLFIFFLFLWPHWLFLFISHLSALGSFNLSSLGSFVCPVWDLFLTLRATLYILQGYRRSHTL